MLPAWQASTNLLLLTPIQAVLTGPCYSMGMSPACPLNLGREILPTLLTGCLLQGGKHSQNGHLSIHCSTWCCNNSKPAQTRSHLSILNPPAPAQAQFDRPPPSLCFPPAMSKCHLNRHCLKQRNGTRPVPPTRVRVGATVCGWWTWAEFRVRECSAILAATARKHGNWIRDRVIGKTPGKWGGKVCTGYE